MSQYLESVNSRNGEADHGASLSQAVRDAFPNVSDCLLGQKDQKGNWTIGPATVMLFLEGPVLKFCISPKNYTQVCFGVVDDLEDVAGSIERALANRACEWKWRGGKK